MPVTPSFRDYVADQLLPLGEVLIKRMFGGCGLYFDGKMFGLIDDDTVYLRVNDETRPTYVARGMSPFQPVRSKPKMVSYNYYQLPEEVLEDSDTLRTWGQAAIQASRSKTAAVVRRERAKTAPAGKKVAARSKRTK